ncbi:MAG: hypothetical protein DRJ40_06080 [Thermoprotei archaeon]|nr:MAG: hypothetical protein DRJ40_06080 [Thermoprotei archaeon]
MGTELRNWVRAVKQYLKYWVDGIVELEGEYGLLTCTWGSLKFKVWVYPVPEYKEAPYRFLRFVLNGVIRPKEPTLLLAPYSTTIYIRVVRWLKDSGELWRLPDIIPSVLHVHSLPTTLANLEGVVCRRLIRDYFVEIVGVRPRLLRQMGSCPRCSSTLWLVRERVVYSAILDSLAYTRMLMCTGCGLKVHRLEKVVDCGR